MKVVIDKEFAGKCDWIKSMPKIFGKEGDIVYKSRNILKKITCDGNDFIVKRYAVPLLFNRVAYTFFRKSKAQRAYENARRLLKEGIPTPQPVAYIERKSTGLLYRAYFISVADKSPYLMRHYVDFVNGGEKVLRQFARFTKTMHDKEILHLDYSPGNILFSTDDNMNASFSIVDLNRMRFDKPVTRKERLMNFRRLARSEEVMRIMITEYASLCGWDIEPAIDEALSYSREFWENTDKKLAIKKKLGKG